MWKQLVFADGNLVRIFNLTQICKYYAGFYKLIINVL